MISVLAQDHTDWELILVDDCSTNPARPGRAAGVRRVRPADPGDRARDQRSHRRRVQRRHRRGPRRVRSRCSTTTTCSPRDALEAIAAGHRAEHEDATTSTPTRTRSTTTDVTTTPFRKPDWSPERLRGQMYTCHLSVLRTSLVREVGGFREGYDGSQDHDLVLRVTEQARRIVPHPRGPLPLAGRPRLRGRDVRRQALRRRRRPEGGPGPPRPARARRPRSTSAPAPASTSPVGPSTRGQRLHRHPHPRRVGHGVGPVAAVFVVEAVRSVLAAAGHQDVEVVVVLRHRRPRPRCSRRWTRSPATA